LASGLPAPRATTIAWYIGIALVHSRAVAAFFAGATRKSESCARVFAVATVWIKSPGVSARATVHTAIPTMAPGRSRTKAA
jgi:hypothetical protein